MEGWSLRASLRALLLYSSALYALLFFTRSSRISLSADDIMNLWVHCIPRSWATELTNIVTFSIPLDRSTATLFYRPIYEAVGLDPVYYRAAVTVLLVISALVTFAVFRSHAANGSALLCTVVLAYLPQFQDIYLWSSAIYDLLASIFLWTAYAAIKGIASFSGRGLLLLAAAVVSYQLALGAKEVALCLPVLLIVESLLTRSRTLAVALLPILLQSAWYVFRKFFAGAAAMTANSGYALEVTAQRAMENLVWYTSYATDFLLREPALWQIALLAAAPLLIAAIARDARPLLGAAFLYTLMGLFLFPFRRSIYVFYAGLPALGLCLLPVTGRVARLPARMLAGLGVAFIAALILWERSSGDKYRVPTRALTAPPAQVLASPDFQNLRAPKGGLVVVKEDPFPLDDYNLHMLLSLRLRDETLRVHRLKFRPAPPGQVADTVVTFGKER
jgi:hypothetical protein